MADVVLRRASLPGVDGTVDVHVRDGLIDSVGPSGTEVPDGSDDRSARPPADVVDLDGRLLLAAAVEPHAHLDKAFLAERVINETGDLIGAIEAMVRARPLLTVADTVERAERAARVMAANGYGAVRTHADTTTDHGLRSIEALIEVRRRVADLIDIEIVALCGWPLTGEHGDAQRGLLLDALDAGADVVGGCPHLDEDGTRRPTEILLGIAAERGLDVDLHTDETLDGRVDGLSELAELVMSSGFPHRVTASHCVSLGQRDPAHQREVAEAVAAAGIAVVTLPVTNLYLQGRDQRQSMPRGITAVRALREAGVVVAAGADNLQDPFNPMGRACPFETAAMMVIATHLSPDDAWTSVTDEPRRALGLPLVAVEPSAPADLMAVPAATLREAIAFAPSDRIVVRRGRVLT